MHIYFVPVRSFMSCSFFFFIQKSMRTSFISVLYTSTRANEINHNHNWCNDSFGFIYSVEIKMLVFNMTNICTLSLRSIVQISNETISANCGFSFVCHNLFYRRNYKADAQCDLFNESRSNRHHFKKHCVRL